MSEEEATSKSNEEAATFLVISAGTVSCFLLAFDFFGAAFGFEIFNGRLGLTPGMAFSALLTLVLLGSDPVLFSLGMLFCSELFDCIVREFSFSSSENSKTFDVGKVSLGYLKK